MMNNDPFNHIRIREIHDQNPRNPRSKKGEETTLSLHLTLTGNITRRYWLLSLRTTIINATINTLKLLLPPAVCKYLCQKFSTTTVY